MGNEEKHLYEERVSSGRTELLFIVMTLVFVALCAWRTSSFTNWDTLAGVFLGLACFFLFTVINYRELVILINNEEVLLRFGVFKWKIPIGTIKHIRLDEIPVFLRYGVAGIHFMTVRKRFRASFNFLEYERICISLKKKRGWVKDVSFSTRKPEEVKQVITEMMKGT